jgi:ATP-binding cassette subfamily B protein
MAWGGWSGGGGMFGGRATAAGLPFGGIPSELMSGATKILETEPVHPPSAIAFTQRPGAKERERLTLPRLLKAYPGYVVAGSTLVILISLVMQVGPLLTEYAINNGMGGSHLRVVGHRSLTIIAICSMLYLASAFVSVYLQRLQVDVTGRLASRVMHDLRIKVFTHFQRLSLDFFTEEKAGVLMSRMTSDIENLQQLIQDGIGSFAMQGLTMIVITAILFKLNVVLAAWTILLIVPLLFVLSVWFHHASEKGYLLVRDRIANVLADLSESLYGIRVVTANNRQPRNIRNHRHVVGAYRDRAGQLHLRTRHHHDRHSRSGTAARHRGPHVPDAQAEHRRARRVLLVPKPLLLPHPVARPAVHVTATGTLFDHSPARAGRDGAQRGRSRERERAAHHRGPHHVRARELRVPAGQDRAA